MWNILPFHISFSGIINWDAFSIYINFFRMLFSLSLFAGGAFIAYKLPQIKGISNGRKYAIVTFIGYLFLGMILLKNGGGSKKMFHITQSSSGWFGRGDLEPNYEFSDSDGKHLNFKDLVHKKQISLVKTDDFSKLEAKIKYEASKSGIPVHELNLDNSYNSYYTPSSSVSFWTHFSLSLLHHHLPTSPASVLLLSFTPKVSLSSLESDGSALYMFFSSLSSLASPPSVFVLSHSSELLTVLGRHPLARVASVYRATLQQKDKIVDQHSSTVTDTLWREAKHNTHSVHNSGAHHELEKYSAQIKKQENTQKVVHKDVEVVRLNSKTKGVLKSILAKNGGAKDNSWVPVNEIKEFFTDRAAFNKLVADNVLDRAGEVVRFKDDVVYQHLANTLLG